MDGLHYIYSGSPMLAIPPIQCPAGQKLRFHVETKAHPAALPTSKHLFPVGKRKPHDERGYASLQAFLKEVVYMEAEFGAVIG